MNPVKTYFNQEQRTYLNISNVSNIEKEMDSGTEESREGDNKLYTCHGTLNLFRFGAGGGLIVISLTTHRHYLHYLYLVLRYKYFL